MTRPNKANQLPSFKHGLRELRLKAGLSQGKVAKALGYSTPQFISNWERGVSEMPFEVIRTLAKLYEVSLEDLFESYIQYKLLQLEVDLRAKISKGKAV